MKITGFGVANYRSFDNEGMFIENFGKINIFIGKNNCGKSNFLRFLNLLAKAKKGQVNDAELKDYTICHRQNGLPPSLLVSFPVSSLEGGGGKSLASFFKNDCSEIKLKLNLQSGAPESELALGELVSGVRWDSLRILSEQLSGGYYHSDEKGNLANITRALASRVRQKILDMFGECIFVKDFRQIREGAAEDGKTIFVDGQNVIKQLLVMQHPDTGKEKAHEVFERIENFVKDLLGLDALKMEIPPTGDKIILNMHGMRLPLESFGTGIHELVILCSALAMYDNHMVCLEEPEIHLHPELQRKFLRFLQQTKNTYFITTHSNVFLDFGEPVNVYHVTYDGTKSTVTKAETDDHGRRVLDDLGYKASDLLQANGIIWVEGPSDRIYIKKWLKLLPGAEEFVEGLHYSILFYGGSNLAHLQAGEADPIEDLIDLLRINKNAMVVIDRDGDSPKEVLAERKQRILKELGEESCWVTEGREVENYLRTELVEKVLSEKTKKDVTLKFGKNARLQKSIDAALPKGDKKREVYYDGDKVGYARKFVAGMSNDDLEPMDLRVWMERIKGHITKWNAPGS